MQESMAQESLSYEVFDQVPRWRRSVVRDQPTQNFHSNAAEHHLIRDSSWRPSGLPHPEAEAFLSNLSVRVEGVGTSICPPGDELVTAAYGPLKLIFVLAGHGVIRSSGDQHQVRCGTLLVAVNVTNLHYTAADHAHSMPASDPAAGELKLACISLSVTAATEAKIFAQLDCALIDYSGDSHVRQTVELLLGEVDRQHIGARSIVESLAKNLLVLALRDHLGKPSYDNSLSLLMSEPQIARVVNAITENPSRRHTMDCLAQLAGMTPQTLSRRFETIFAMAPLEYVLRVRLTAAEGLLRNSDLPIKTIAGKVGFASRSHFSRRFSKFSGFDPTAYRIKHR